MTANALFINESIDKQSLPYFSEQGRLVTG